MSGAKHDDEDGAPPVPSGRAAVYAVSFAGILALGTLLLVLGIRP
ncbi:hypothetical protein P3T37_005122 [Kitasatospora sp. MAA4]|nr:hypothetical protein [Kitasatospora sp. MAA4]MDH6135705.1 hypothetical protein [Kitasatospora sp. MAA4]